MLPRLREVPGVQAATLSDGLPAAGNGSIPVQIEGKSYPQASDYPLAREGIVTAGYFDTFETKVLSGREFTPADTAANLPVAIVANKVRPSMPAYQPFLRFLVSLQGKLLARLLDSDMYVRAVESGIGIFEMDPGQTQVERRQFAPIVDWVTGEQTPAGAAEQVYELPQIRRVSL